MATFPTGEKVYFGSTRVTYFVNHMDVEKRDAWRSRHRVRAGEHKTVKALTYYLLQGDSHDFATNLAAFAKRFKL